MGAEKYDEVLISLCQSWLQGRPQPTAHDSDFGARSCSLYLLTFALLGGQTGKRKLSGTTVLELSKRVFSGMASPIGSNVNDP